MSTPIVSHPRAAALILASLGLLFASGGRAEAAEIRHTVDNADLCRVNPVRHAPLRASKDAVIEADVHLREAIGDEVRARAQEEAAEERFAELQAAYAPRSDLRSARVYMSWARMEHRLTEARLEQAEALRVLGAAELELGKLQLMEAYQIEEVERYRVSRFEDQLDSAQWDYDRATEKVERLEKRLVEARASWESTLATR